MGNDILNKPQKDIFITTKKLKHEKSCQDLSTSSFEKVFGKAEEKTLRKIQTVPCIHLQEVIVEQNTFQENSSPPLQQTRARTNNQTRVHISTETIIQNEALLDLQQQIKNLKKRIQQQNYCSRSYSPVKHQKQNIIDSMTFNKTMTRNRKHYFKLKGCQPLEQIDGNELGDQV